MKKKIHGQKIWDFFSSSDFVECPHFKELENRNLFLQLKPSRFADLIAGVSLCRPIEDFVIENFLSAKETFQKHRDESILSEILVETYGFLLYREQIIQIAHQIGNFSLEEASIFRVALAREQCSKIPEFKGRFLKNVNDNNISQEKGRAIFNLLQKYAPFAFSHAYATTVAKKYYKIASNIVFQ